MKMSSAPSFGAPGSLIFGVAYQKLKKHKFTAMPAQHVASELRMHMWTSRSRTERNTPSRLKIDFDFINITDFRVITDIPDFMIFTGFRHVWGRNWRCADNN